METESIIEIIVGISRGGCLIFLIVLSVTDMKIRQIPALALTAGNAAAVLYQMACRQEDFISIAGGAAVGIVFLLIAKLTRESIGYGDGLGILGLGIYLGFWKLLEVLASAFFLLAVGAAIILGRKKMSRKCALPFYPFLTVGYAAWLVIG